MTVEAYLRAKVSRYPFEMSVLENAALSPIFAKPSALSPLDLNDEVEAHIVDGVMDAEFERALKYAESTLYYSVSGAFSGGSRSEQVGDVRASLSGFIITQADRDFYRNLAHKLRKELGVEIEDLGTTAGRAFDASALGRRPSQSASGFICPW